MERATTDLWIWIRKSPPSDGTAWDLSLTGGVAANKTGCGRALQADRQDRRIPPTLLRTGHAGWPSRGCERSGAGSARERKCYLKCDAALQIPCSN